MLTSGIGLFLLFLGAAVWADLQPIYWLLEFIRWSLANITTVLPREITGPLVLVVGGGLIWLGQSRSLGRFSRRSHPIATPFWWMPLRLRAV